MRTRFKENNEQDPTQQRREIVEILANAITNARPTHTSRKQSVKVVDEPADDRLTTSQNDRSLSHAGG